MGRRFFGKRKRNYKVVFYLMLFSLSFISTFKLILGEDAKEYFLSSMTSEIISNDILFLENFNDKITSPKYMLYTNLNKIVDKNNLSVFSSIEDDLYDYSESKSEYVEDPSPSMSFSAPLVYIYNTHQLEEYSSKMPYDYSVKPNVMIASYIMREKLGEYGISSVVETHNIKEYLSSNNMSYKKSYQASEYFARLMQEKYPSIEYLIDIHRDSATYNTTYVEIDGIGYARVLLVSGMEHTIPENNLGFANELNDLIEVYYPGLSRGVLVKTGTSVNGVYNQNLNGKSVLIEVGGVDNRIEEVNNTVEALSHVLSIYIEGEV